MHNVYLVLLAGVKVLGEFGLGIIILAGVLVIISPLLLRKG